MFSILFFTGITVLGALFLWIVLPHLMRKWQERHLGALCVRRRAIVLSYDDGPGRLLTPQLADLLQHRATKATFFMIGQKAGQHPDLVFRLRQDGHEIANHTQLHANAWKVAPWTAVRDILAGQRTLMGLGSRADLFRPPFGKATLATLVLGFAAKLRFAYWTVDTRDSWEDPWSVQAVTATIRRQGGGVVLMHDCDSPPRSLRPERHPDHILALTEAIIDLAAKEGFSMVTIGDLLRPQKRGALHG